MQAFHHFLTKHIEFDSEEGEDGGHGALVRHFAVDDTIAPMWESFADQLSTAIETQKFPKAA